MRVLIDGDILVYRAGFATEKSYYEVYPTDPSYSGSPIGVYKTKRDIPEMYKTEEYELNRATEAEPTSFAITVLRQMIKGILDGVSEHTGGNVDFQMYLSGKTNFRNDVKANHKYKGNRDNVAKPVHYAALREALEDKYFAIVSDNKEADDDLAIAQCTLSVDTCIASIDKDLLQVAGLHYDIVKKTMTTVTEDEGLKLFYEQLLKGDAVDNIIGLKGIGLVKARKLLKDAHTEAEMFKVCNDMYNLHEREEWEIESNAQLLWLLRSEEESGKWSRPDISHLDSTDST